MGKSRRFHPKVQALADIVAEIATGELKKVEINPETWVSKVLVFNKLINTARHLRKVLTDRLEPIFSGFLEEQLKAKGWEARDGFAHRVRECIRSGLAEAKAAMLASCPGRCQVPAEFGHECLVKHGGQHLMDAYCDTILRRTEQPLFLARCVLDVEKPSDLLLRSWVESQVVEPVKNRLIHVVELSKMWSLRFRIGIDNGLIE